MSYVDGVRERDLWKMSMCRVICNELPGKRTRMKNPENHREITWQFIRKTQIKKNLIIVKANKEYSAYQPSHLGDNLCSVLEWLLVIFRWQVECRMVDGTDFDWINQMINTRKSRVNRICTALSHSNVQRGYCLLGFSIDKRRFVPSKSLKYHVSTAPKINSKWFAGDCFKSTKSDTSKVMIIYFWFKCLFALSLLRDFSDHGSWRCFFFFKRSCLRNIRGRDTLNFLIEIMRRALFHTENSSTSFRTDSSRQESSGTKWRSALLTNYICSQFLNGS